LKWNKFAKKFGIIRKNDIIILLCKGRDRNGKEKRSAAESDLSVIS